MQREDGPKVEHGGKPGYGKRDGRESSRTKKAPGVFHNTGALKRRFHTKEKTSLRALGEAPETKQTKSWSLATAAGFKALG
jgi:hypothetical protein